VNVGVVIVNKNAGRYLAMVLESLERQTLAPHRVVIVDNASTDDSLDGLEARFPSILLIRSKENLGFAAANNLAVGMCDDCEFVALLNPDAFPEPAWLETLVAAAVAHPEAAFFGSRLVRDDDPTVLDGTGDMYHVSGMAWRRDQGVPVTAERDSNEAFSACAAAALYRRDVWIAVGGLDESFFCYYEDTDLAFRLRLAGHRCLYVPDAVARHVGSATTGLLSAFTIYHSTRNQVWTYVKNMPRLLFWLYLPQHLLFNALTVLAYAVQGQGRAALAGKRDALRGLPRILAERRRIQAARVATSKEMRSAMARGAGGYIETFASRFQTRKNIEPSAKRSHLGHLDGLRGLAALFVVFHHTWLTIWPDLYATHLPLLGSATRVFAFGHFGVVVFIVLSGFCLALPVARTGGLEGGSGRFFLRRAKRLLPPYYASLALSLVLIWTLIGGRTGTHWDIAVPVDKWGYIGNSLLMGDVLGGGQINHVWWSVALEWQIYLVFPLLVFFWVLFGARLALAVACLIAAAVSFAAGHFPVLGPVQLQALKPWFLILFALGMLGAAVVETDAPSMRRLRETMQWGRVGVVSAFGVVALCIAAGRHGVLSHIEAMDLVVGASAVCLIVASCLGEGRIRSVLSWRPLVLVGGFSYSLYLIHAPLLQVVWQYGLHPLGLGASATFALLALVGVPAIVGASYLFFLAFELPFLSPAHRARLGIRRPATLKRRETVTAAMPLPAPRG
jgi:GT2 family glycosyltransferase/peptidoglycan/LPS O-acetylase OafA/YrhL